VIAIDTSAIVAIALLEPEALAFSEAITGMPCIIGWPTVLEAHMVLSGIPRRRGLDTLDKALSAPRLTVLPFDGLLYQAARDAFDRYGKGRGHRAQLNFGDCMAYAVAKARDVPLLYKGADFGRTDIRPALP
jgi:ribonuclease VapC